MQYHALAWAAQGADVDLVGYTGAPLPAAITAHPRITTHRLAPPDLDRGPGRPTPARLGQAAWRLLLLAWRLLRLLILVTPRPDVVLVQNPPAVSTLVVAALVARLRRARLVIDWHNFSHSVLALRLGAGHRLVRFVRWHERTMAVLADHHLVVSEAMRRELVDRDGLRGVTVLYDRPAEAFTVLPPDERVAEKARWLDLADTTEALQVGLLVTSTSWTADEDMTLLIAALELCEARFAADTGAVACPRLEVIISGDGPLRAAFDRRLASRVSGRIRIRTCWLAPEDYPRLLAAADLGVCVHRSTSGLDLPMKLADMHGCGLPVCVLDYGPVLRERLPEGRHGRYFSSAEALATQIVELFDRFPDGAALTTLRARARDGERTSWRQGWNREARDVL